jgi:glycine/D-amino acid oxidase-like deaminating enzyme
MATESHRMAPGRLVLALAAGLTMTPALQAATPVESVGAMLMRMQEESAAPFITYCGGKVPNLRRSLEKEYVRYRKKFTQAMAPLRQQIQVREEFARPAPPALLKQFEDMGAQSFAQAQTLDPRAFCKGLKDNLADADVETIRRNMQSALSEYSAAVRQGR